MAKRGVNKVVLMGNIGQDPEIRDVANGKKMATLSVATSDVWKNDQGEQQEKTEWHRVTAFGALAGIIESYAKKGAKVYLEAELKTRKWQDEQGKDQYSLDIIIPEFNGVFQIISQAPTASGAAPAPAQSAPAPSQSAPAPAQSAPAPAQAPVIDDGDDDDIPF